MPPCLRPRKPKTAFVAFETDHKPINEKSLLQRRAKQTLTVKVVGLKYRDKTMNTQSIRKLRGSIMSDDRRVRDLIDTAMTEVCRIVN
jgi:hypothetical protein